MPLHPHHPFRHLAGALAVLLAILGLALPGAAQTFTVIHSFDRGLEGRFYDSPLILGSDGRLYGTTSHGGKYDHGTIFTLAVDGTGFTVLKHFSGTAADGIGPKGGLVQGQDGRLYGTSQYGTIFSLNSDGSDFRVIRILTNLSEGTGLLGGLVQDAAGRLYGVASNGGGGANIGTVYSLRPDGSDFKVHQHLSNALGTAPRGRLCFGPDGRLYGTTSAGGNFGAGTIFALDPTAAPETGCTVLRHLNAATDGGTPYAGLIYGSDGRFYGVNRTGGANNTGTLFTLSVAPGGGVTYTVLQTFANAQPGSTGINPSSELIQGLDGRLYGTTQFQSYSRVFAFDLVTNQFTNLRVLTIDEGQNLGGVIQAPNGRLFGTAADFGVFDHGSIFSLDPSGANFTVLRQGEPHSRGHQPRGALAEGPDGRLYGTTYNGGKTTTGTIFRVDRDGANFAVAWERDPASNSNLFLPGGFTSGLTLAPNGDFYGTSEYGNAAGALYVYRPGNQTVDVVYGFGLFQNGGDPAGEVWSSGDGWLYGLTERLGSYSGGTFYAVNLNPGSPSQPSLETRFAFQYGTTSTGSGTAPLGRIMRGSDGRYYGTASGQGQYSGGTLFSLKADGTGFTVLHAFGATGDGRTPAVGVVQAPNGRLFGTTRAGPDNRGTLYSIKPDGTDYKKHREFASFQSTLSELVVGPDGRIYGGLSDVQAFSGPTTSLFSINATGDDYVLVRTLSILEGRGQISLAVLSDGLIYGAASAGGEYGSGTLFSLAVVPPPVITSPVVAQGTYGQPFSYAITATNAPTDFDALNLPAALAVNHAAGTITGTPQVTGLFPVDIAASNAGGTGLASLSLTIAKAPAGIAFSNLAHTFDGTPKHPTITTTPAGLPLLTTYNGSLSAPTNAGSYLVESSVVDPNYTGSGSATLTISPVPTPTPTPLPVPVDITSSVAWVQGGFRLNRASRRYAQVVTLQNPNADRGGPVSFVLDGLPAGVTLTPNSGLTASVSPAGSPYVNLSLDDGVLNHLESVSFTLEFTNPANQPIAYQVRVLAGPGNR